MQQQQQQQQQRVSYPLLDMSELLLFTQHLGTNVGADKLKNPTPEMMEEVHQNLLFAFMGYKPETQMQFGALQSFEKNPQLYIESYSHMQFARALTKFATVCGVDYGFRDMIKPEAERVRNFLSASVNFARFHEEKLRMYDLLVSEKEVLQQKLDAAEAQNQQLTGRLHECQMQRKQEEPQVEELTKDCDRLKQRVCEFNKQGADLTKRNDEMKTQKLKMHDKIARDQFAFMGLEKEKKKLQAQIVRSPERAKQELRNLKDRVEAETAEAEEFEQKAHEHAQKIEGLAKIQKDLATLQRLLQEINTDDTKGRTIKETTQDLLSQSQTSRQMLAEWELKEQTLRKQIRALKERAAEMESRHRVREEAATRDTQNAINAQKESEKENRKAIEELENIEVEKSVIRHKKMEREQQHTEHQKALTTEYARMEADLVVYHRAIAMAIQEARGE